MRDEYEDLGKFDAGWYLQAYPDIADAVNRGNVGSALEHYLKHGRSEGRNPYDRAESNRAPLVPIIVSSTARAGTTILMKVLMDHPKIVAPTLAPYEVRPASYYAHLMRVATSPADPHDYSVRDTFDESALSISSNPFDHQDFDSAFPSPSFSKDFFRETVPLILAPAFRSAIDVAYRSFADHQGKSAPIFFVEKCDISRFSRRSLRNLYPNCLEIVLVRDMRDVLCSWKEFFGKGGDGQFSDVASIADHLRQIGDRLVDVSRNATAKRTIIKYEDLVLRRTDVVRSLAHFLGIDGDWPSNQRAEDELHLTHATTSSPSQSIGRWKSYLSDEEMAFCTQRFRDYLDEFEYE